MIHYLMKKLIKQNCFEELEFFMCLDYNNSSLFAELKSCLLNKTVISE